MDTPVAVATPNGHLSRPFPFLLLHDREEVIGALKALTPATPREELARGREPLILLVVGVAHLTLAERIAVDLLLNAHYVCSPYEARDVFVSATVLSVLTKII